MSFPEKRYTLSDGTTTTTDFWEWHFDLQNSEAKGKLQSRSAIPLSSESAAKPALFESGHESSVKKCRSIYLDFNTCEKYSAASCQSTRKVDVFTDLTLGQIHEKCDKGEIKVSKLVKRYLVDLEYLLLLENKVSVSYPNEFQFNPATKIRVLLKNMLEQLKEIPPHLDPDSVMKQFLRENRIDGKT